MAVEREFRIRILAIAGQPALPEGAIANMKAALEEWMCSLRDKGILTELEMGPTGVGKTDEVLSPKQNQEFYLLNFRIEQDRIQQRLRRLHGC